MGKIITFYSYKGGVGRSMCLANTAILLAKWQYKVLIVDWDLEAPGLENFYMAGQWVVPGGGVPPCFYSARHVIQILCKRDGKKFSTSVLE